MYEILESTRGLLVGYFGACNKNGSLRARVLLSLGPGPIWGRVPAHWAQVPTHRGIGSGSGAIGPIGPGSAPIWVRPEPIWP